MHIFAGKAPLKADARIPAKEVQVLEDGSKFIKLRVRQPEYSDSVYQQELNRASFFEPKEEEKNVVVVVPLNEMVDEPAEPKVRKFYFPANMKTVGHIMDIVFEYKKQMDTALLEQCGLVDRGAIEEEVAKRLRQKRRNLNYWITIMR
jgi:hypothetical protein